MSSTMPSCLKIYNCITYVVVVSSLICTASPAKLQNLCPFEYLYQFGDSHADTGNRIRQVGATSIFNSSSLPYGETYFHKPTGRMSNGLLVIDFIAKALNLPFLHPHLETNASFSHGANFAVAGSTALDNSFFAERNITVSSTNIPLSQQIQWFKQHLDSISNKDESEQKRRLGRALIIMGEIGGNDINRAIENGMSIDEIIRRNIVPFIIQSVSNGVREAIQLGATYIVLPGNFPVGCTPKFLTEQFPTTHDHPQAYDDVGCLTTYNQLVLYFNKCLKRAVASLTLEFPDVVIRYFDNYKAVVSILHSGGKFGFDQPSLLKACCGIGGKYNYDYDEIKVCGSQGVEACENPAEFVYWDGVHYTQEAYRHIAHHLIQDVLSEMSCKIMNPADSFPLEFQVPELLDLPTFPY